MIFKDIHQTSIDIQSESYSAIEIVKPEDIESRMLHWSNTSFTLY